MITNTDSIPLDAVVVNVTGTTYPLGSLKPGESKQVNVVPTGESHVEIDHRAVAGERLGVDTYFEPGYRGTLRVRMTADSILTVDQDIRVGRPAY